MRSTPRRVLFTLAAACWLAAGPGGETTRALLACHHDAAHHASGAHHAAPSDGPCFCDQMTGGLDLAVSTAVPTPPVASPAVAAIVRVVTYPSLFPLPPSPLLGPTPPPPNGLG
ncbi:MAG TPA: hypothetical protein VK531_10400 [Gemmatimonadales bacterium]|nr:hypothetical protein [Gemmatimonadales bacterium]